MTAATAAAAYTATLNENAMTILSARYLQQGESVDGLWDRVSGGNPKFRRLLEELRFLPNSPTLFNAGLNNGCTLSACFVFSVDDTMLDTPRGILPTRNKAAAVAKAGGGVGYWLGDLRPKGSLIRSVHRKACGPVAVLRDYHGLRALITQGGKRDLAQMGVLPCWHEDIREFIHCKDKDPQGLSSFNISVGWTDEALHAAHHHADDTGETYHKLWTEQVDSAWRTGDPGTLFSDRVERDNWNPHLGPIRATNPCFTGDTKVWTIYGPRRFDELVHQQVPVLTQSHDGDLEFRMMRGIRKTGEGRRVYRVTLRNRRGHGQKYVYGSFTATADHMVFLRDGGQRRVIDLRPGDRLASAYRRRANQQGYLALYNSAGDQDMEHRIVASWRHGCRPAYPEFHVHHVDEDKANNHPDNLEVVPAKEHNGANMRGDKNPMVRFPEKNHFRGNPQGSSGFKGRRHTEESKRKISQGQARARREGKRNHEVVLVEYVGREDVYDGTVNGVHRFFVCTEDDGGVLVHNCGETPNRSDEPCNLGSQNLACYSIPATRSVDFDRLAADAYDCTLFLDDVLDRNTFPHPDITAAALATRKLGLGVMGWADLLALCHIHYDTEEAVALGRKVMATIKEASRRASADLGRQKGPYAGYDVVKSQTDARRNETTTSIAPTGTIALIAGASSGIEPYFALEWDRTTYEGLKLRERIPVWDRLDGFVPKVASEIAPEWHVRHQAAFQESTDLGVSKTVNLPNGATREDVSGAYRLMWELGCKGGTVFRDGCRSEQVLVARKLTSVYTVSRGEVGSVESSRETERSGDLPASPLLPQPIVQVPPLPRRHKLPRDRQSLTHKFVVDGVEGYLTAGLYDDGSPGEIFLRVSKQGSTMGGMLDMWAMTFSLALQYGTPLASLVNHHTGTRFDPSGFTENQELPVCTSIMDYVVRWLELRFLVGTSPAALDEAESDTPVGLHVSVTTRGYRSGHLCPECGGEAIRQGGCLTCGDGCGWSRCG